MLADAGSFNASKKLFIIWVNTHFWHPYQSNCTQYDHVNVSFFNINNSLVVQQDK